MRSENRSALRRSSDTLRKGDCPHKKGYSASGRAIQHRRRNRGYDPLQRARRGCKAPPSGLRQGAGLACQKDLPTARASIRFRVEAKRDVEARNPMPPSRMPRFVPPETVPVHIHELGCASYPPRAARQRLQPPSCPEALPERPGRSGTAVPRCCLARPFDALSSVPSASATRRSSGLGPPQLLRLNLIRSHRWNPSPTGIARAAPDSHPVRAAASLR